jgi:hypothetical protein
LAENQATDVTFLSTEGSTNADFSRAADDFVSEQSVKTNAGKDQGEESEESGKTSNQALVERQTIDGFGLSAEIRFRSE